MAAMKCPNCDTLLTSSEAVQGKCPFCRAALPASETRRSSDRNKKTELRNVERPTTVRIALILLFGTLGVGILRAFLDPSAFGTAARHNVPKSFVVSVLLGTFVLVMLWYLLIASGRWWAFLITIVLAVIGLPFSITALQSLIRHDLTSFYASIAQMLMQFTAYVLLFTASARTWFRAKREQRQGVRPAYS